MTSALPHLLDELAARATASPTTESVDGWLLRAAPDWPFRRSNSALPLDPTGDLAATVVELEAFYARHELPARVQVSSGAPAALDPFLADRGYEIEAPVDILVADSSYMRARTNQAVEVDLSHDLDDEWIEVYDATDERLRAYAALLRAIEPVSYAATAAIGGAPAGVGIAVIERGWAGIYGMGTRPEAQRRGVATSILHTCAALAPQCYLQVEVDNVSAQALYAGAGFTRAYGYHYRTRT